MILNQALLVSASFPFPVDLPLPAALPLTILRTLGESKGELILGITISNLLSTQYQCLSAAW